VPAGSTQQFRATGTYTDGSTADLTAGVTWSSSDPSVATVDANGLGFGRERGHGDDLRAIGNHCGDGRVARRLTRRGTNVSSESDPRCSAREARATARAS